MDSTVKTKDTAAQKHGAAHTPGPWKCEPPLFGYYVIRQDPKDWDGMGYQSICSAHATSKKNPYYHAMFAANARLIAAAPELLANLEFAVKLLAPLLGHTAQVEHMLAVIAKARGSEQRSHASDGPTKAQAE